MRAIVRLAWRAAQIALVALLALTAWTTSWGDKALYPPADADQTVTVYVVNHGYHAGLIMPQEALAQAAAGLPLLGAAARRFDGYRWLEIGWGDEDFYRYVPALASLTMKRALRAMAGLNETSVLHIAGFDPAPARAFRGDMVSLTLSQAGFARLAAELDQSFARAESDLPVELGPGNYGQSLFYKANGRYHAFNVCNHWIARLLRAAGVPAAPVLATYPSGLLADLRWRGGAK